MFNCKIPVKHDVFKYFFRPSLNHITRIIILQPSKLMGILHLETHLESSYNLSDRYRYRLKTLHKNKKKI